jgi:hypothetical protein
MANRLLIGAVFAGSFVIAGQAQQDSGKIPNNHAVLAPSNQNGPSAKPASNEDSEMGIPFMPGMEPGQGEERKIPKREDVRYEDWDGPSMVAAMETDIESLGEFEGAGFTRELVHAQWRELDPIDLWVVKPIGVKQPPVVLYLYSYPSSNERYKDDDFCRMLVKNGFAAVGFVPALTEHRFHDRPTNQWFVSQLQESMATSSHDVTMILNYLQTRGDVDMKRVGIWGDGAGAGIAIMAAAVDTRIRALDLLDPWGSWPEWLAKSSLVPENQRAKYLTPAFLKSVANLDPIQWFPKLTSQRVRLQQIASVTVTPETVRQRFETAAASNVKFEHYDSTKTFFTEVGSKGAGFDWIKLELSSASDVREAENRKPAKPSGNTADASRQ